MMRAALFTALLLASGFRNTAAAKVTPIEKVISMLNDMMAKGKQEKQDEEVRFTSFKGFCESQTKVKTKDITEAKEDIEQLAADIQKAASDAMVATKEIAALDKDMAAWEEDKKEATAIREEAHAEFETLHADYTKSIDAVERALQALKAGPASLAQTSLLQLSSVGRVPAKAKSLIMSFLQSSDRRLPMSALMQDAAAEADGLDSSAPEAKAFESSSGGVINMVTELGEKFEDERTALEKKEAEERHSHDMMMGELTNQIKAAKQERGSASAAKSGSEQAGAEAEGDLAATKTTLGEDEKFLADMTAECEQKTTDFHKRQEMRQEEIDAIAKAIEIMSSDKVAGSDPKAFVQQGVAGATSLVQLRSSSSRSPMQTVVASFLNDQAQRSNSRVLSLLAVKVSEDPFKKVTKMIKDMIFKLMEEANEEAEHQGFCNTELSTNKQTRDSKTEEAVTLKAEIEDFTATIAKLGTEIADLGGAIAEIDAAVAKATTERQEEKAKNTATIADAKAGQEAVGQAIDVLKEFYDKAATAAFMQTSNGVQQMPEMESGGYSGMAGGGVLGMLEVCESDFARLLTETEATEDDAAKEFSEFSSDSAVDKATKSTNMKMKTNSKQQKESALATAKKDLVAVQEELDAAMAYYEKLKPSCVDAGESYEERVARRKAEIESLQEALKILSGDSV